MNIGQHYFFLTGFQHKFEMKDANARSKSLLEFQRQIIGESGGLVDDNSLLGSRLPLFSLEEAQTPALSSSSSVDK